MALYEVSVRRKVVHCRVMSVEAKSPEAARRRALSILRHERGVETEPEPNWRDSENEGEWDDLSYGRPVVEKIELGRVTECPHGFSFGQLCAECGRRVTREDIERTVRSS
jgi:hypothetical protein